MQAADINMKLLFISEIKLMFMNTCIPILKKKVDVFSLNT